MRQIIVIYDRFDVVKVPFPFTDKHSTKVRPALVVSNSVFNGTTGKTVLAMITSTTKNEWLHDTPVTDLGTAGLTVQSLIRMKIFTIDNPLILQRLGRLAVDDAINFENNFSKLTDFKCTLVSNNDR